MAPRNPKFDGEGRQDQTICGLIMPISATSSRHDEKYWASVQTLLHRAISDAGLVPGNVWEGLNDRISKRIVSNIFSREIVVADISDQNPNVMLELGLRLASRKPTVVVVNNASKIPFDIGDVEAIIYPEDLNILGMETFFDKFSDILKGRLAAHRDGKYEAFLGDVFVEVIEPQRKEVSAADAVIDRLEEISLRLNRIENRYVPNPAAYAGKALDLGFAIPTITGAVPLLHQSDLEKFLTQRSISYTSASTPDSFVFVVSARNQLSDLVILDLHNFIQFHDGSFTVPTDVKRRLGIV